jgi:3D (Asp-Asp-Asp) domain-containing protein
MKMKTHILLFGSVSIVPLLMPQLALAARASSSHTIVATVTAYTSARSSITASGTPVFDGVMACPRKYPFGTRFKIEGKVYKCQDRPSAKYGNRFDIWKPTKVAARAFGKKKLTVVRLASHKGTNGN